MVGVIYTSGIGYTYKNKTKTPMFTSLSSLTYNFLIKQEEDTVSNAGENHNDISELSLFIYHSLLEIW